MNSQWHVPFVVVEFSVNTVLPDTAWHWSAGLVTTSVARGYTTKCVVSDTAGQLLAPSGVTVSFTQYTPG